MAKARILVVEDESIVAMDIEMSLRSLGYEIAAVVASGEQAIKKVAESKPDLVLMDIILKGEMDGIKAAEHIRSRFRVPIVFLTAYADGKTLKRAKITEPFGYITKPFRDADLRAAVAIAIYKAKMEAEREQLIAELQEALATIRTLSGLIPICAWCKQVRTDKGYWQTVEDYIAEHSAAEFTHGICPDCLKKVSTKSTKDKTATDSIGSSVSGNKRP